MLVESRCGTASRTADTAMHAAASTWGPRPPPNSLAISPLTSTTRPAASADANLSPTSESPNSSLAARASSGVSGGWSA